MYMMKTPFFLGSFSAAIQEAVHCQIGDDDHASITYKNLLIVRALSLEESKEVLATFLQSLMISAETSG